MFFICTEDDSFLHSACLLEIVGYFFRYLTNAVFYDDIVVVIGIVVYAVFYKLTVDVCLTFEWSPTVTYVCLDIKDLEGSEEAIVYALLEAVGIERLFEVIYV